MSKASLVIVGSGIKFMSHLTMEAKAYIEQSSKVLYLINEPAMKKWIQKVNKNSESLDDIYKEATLRIHSYQAITSYILKTLHNEKHVCVVIYGHPTFFAKPALDAVLQARQEGYFAKVLPGISSEACLFADLLIDPGTHGCLSLEATDILIKQRNIDPSCHLIIWQPSVIGSLNHSDSHDNTIGIQLLFNHLKKYYAETHPVISYTAGQYPGVEPKIEHSTLSNLLKIKLLRTSSLYIPPNNYSAFNTAMLEALNITPADLQIEHNEK